MMGLSAAPAATDNLRLLLDAVSHPAKTRERLEQIVAAEQRLGDLEAKSATLDLDRQTFESAKADWLRDKAAEQQRLSDAWEKHNAAADALRVEGEKHAADVKTQASEVAKFAEERKRYTFRVAAAIEKFQSQIAE